MNPHDWFALVLACCAGAISPGPSLALVLRHATGSAKAGVICSWSHALGVGVYAGAAVSGLALLLQRDWLVWVIGIAGSVWLLRLALALWRDHGALVSSDAALGPAARDGLAMGLLNPKVALFFLAIFTAVLPAEAQLSERVAAVLIAILIDGSWYSIVSLALQPSGAQQWLRRHAQHINRASAVIFGALALWIWRGLLA